VLVVEDDELPEAGLSVVAGFFHHEAPFVVHVAPFLVHAARFVDVEAAFVDFVAPFLVHVPRFVEVEAPFVDLQAPFVDGVTPCLHVDESASHCVLPCLHDVRRQRDEEPRCPRHALRHDTVVPAMTVRPVVHADSFAAALHRVYAATEWTQIVLAGHLGISPKTLGRYTRGEAFPPVGRRHGIVHALRDLDPALLLQVVRSLGLGDDFAHGLPRAPASADHTATQRIVADAVNEVAERVDAGPGRTRLALITFLERLDAAHIDLAAAKTALAAARAEKAAKRAAAPGA
jgi:hypothetical protein